MADKIIFELDGFESLLEELKDLPDNVKRNGIQNTFKRYAKKIEADAQALVRRETGKLASFIKSRQRRTRSKNFFKFTIAATLGERPQPKNKRVFGRLVKNPKFGTETKEGAFYAPFIEFGTSRIPEKSYLRAALENNAQATVSSITSNLRSELNKASVRDQRKMLKKGGSMK